MHLTIFSAVTVFDLGGYDADSCECSPGKVPQLTYCTCEILFFITEMFEFKVKIRYMNFYILRIKLFCIEMAAFSF